MIESGERGRRKMRKRNRERKKEGTTRIYMYMQEQASSA